MGRTNGPHADRQRRTCRTLVGGLLLLDAALVTAGVDPSILLFDATLSEARAFATDAAIARGWILLDATPTRATFEQVLEADRSQDALIVRRLLHVSAEFTEESAGVRVSLAAIEIEWPDTERSWSSDVTARYGDNLMNALSSLQGKWDARRRRGRSAASPAGLAGPPEEQRAAGTWSYYAEHYAQGRGCELGDQGARLVDTGQDWEHYRIPCSDGTWMRVDCRYGDCTAAP